MKFKTLAGAVLSVPIGRWALSVFVMAGFVTLVMYLVGDDPDFRFKLTICAWLIITVSGAYLVLSGKALDPNR